MQSVAEVLHGLLALLKHYGGGVVWKLAFRFGVTAQEVFLFYTTDNKGHMYSAVRTWCCTATPAVAMHKILFKFSGKYLILK